MPTFRTDDWPIVEGVNYTKEAEAAAKENLAKLKAEAEIQALDRKVRQKMIDLSISSFFRRCTSIENFSYVSTL